MSPTLLAIQLDLPLGPTPLPPEVRVQRWVKEARRGDSDAMRSLYETHAPRLYRALRPLAKDAVEDIVQETFLRAFSSLESYQPRPHARFISWLLRIGTNDALGRRRGQAREVPTADEWFAEAGGAAGGDEKLVQRRRAMALERALEELDERSRLLLCLRYGGELSVREVAETAGLEESNVRKICQRARARVLAVLQPNLEPIDQEMKEASDGARGTSAHP